MTPFHGDMRRQTQFLKVYASHTMLTPPLLRAHFVMFKVSIHVCRSRCARHNGRKPNSHLQRTNSNYVFLKSSNSQDHLFWACPHPHSSPISCLGVYYDKWYYLPTPPLGQDMTQGQFLSGVWQVWIQSFPSPRLVASPRLKKLVRPTIYP